MKAILVIDKLPNDIDITELRINYQIDLYGDEIYRGRDTLRPMPKKIQVWRIAKILADNVEEEMNSNQTRYARGWNDCLDEILGEKNENN